MADGPGDADQQDHGGGSEHLSEQYGYDVHRLNSTAVFSASL